MASRASQAHGFSPSACVYARPDLPSRRRPQRPQWAVRHVEEVAMWTQRPLGRDPLPAYTSEQM